jgi:hypothetical protein
MELDRWVVANRKAKGLSKLVCYLGTAAQLEVFKDRQRFHVYLCLNVKLRN